MTWFIIHLITVYIFILKYFVNPHLLRHLGGQGREDYFGKTQEDRTLGMKDQYLCKRYFSEANANSMSCQAECPIEVTKPFTFHLGKRIIKVCVSS